MGLGSRTMHTYRTPTPIIVWDATTKSLLCGPCTCMRMQIPLHSTCGIYPRDNLLIKVPIAHWIPRRK